MTSSTYTPASGSTADRVCQFFAKQRDEELSKADIALKFDVATSGVDAVLARAVETQLLTREKSASGVVFRAGPKLPKPQPATPLPAGAAQRPTRRGVRLPPLNLDEIKIETGIPVAPLTRNGVVSGQRMYAPLIKKLQPGQSFQVPKEYRGTLSSAIKALCKEHPEPKPEFTVRLVNDTHARVWRTK